MSSGSSPGARFTNLFGGSCDDRSLEAGRIGAAEPNENIEGESGPILDLRLPCWDSGRMDSLRIQEPLEDTES